VREIKELVIHYSSSGDVSAETIKDWHKKRGFSDIGYHKVIRKNGVIEGGRAEDKKGAHTLVHNRYSLGVCLTGSNNHPWYPTGKQLGSLRQVIHHWKSQHPAAKVYLHRELSPTQCPGVFTKELLEDDVTLEQRITRAEKKFTELFIRTDIMIKQIETLYERAPGEAVTAAEIRAIIADAVANG